MNLRQGHRFWWVKAALAAGMVMAFAGCVVTAQNALQLVSSVPVESAQCASVVSQMQKYNEDAKAAATPVSACFAPVQFGSDPKQVQTMCHPNGAGNFCCHTPGSCTQCSTASNTPC